MLDRKISKILGKSYDILKVETTRKVIFVEQIHLTNFSEKYAKFFTFQNIVAFRNRRGQRSSSGGPLLQSLGCKKCLWKSIWLMSHWYSNDNKGTVSCKRSLKNKYSLRFEWDFIAKMKVVSLIFQGRWIPRLILMVKKHAGAVWR